MAENEEKRPGEELLEIQRKRLLSFNNLLDIHSRKKVGVKITVEFEHPTFKDKGFAILDIRNSKSIYHNLIIALMNEAENEADKVISQLRELNKKSDDSN
jgi:hypothetical protein